MTLGKIGNYATTTYCVMPSWPSIPGPASAQFVIDYSFLHKRKTTLSQSAPNMLISSSSFAMPNARFINNLESGRLLPTAWSSLFMCVCVWVYFRRYSIIHLSELGFKCSCLVRFSPKRSRGFDLLLPACHNIGCTHRDLHGKISERWSSGGGGYTLCTHRPQAARLVLWSINIWRRKRKLSEAQR